MKEKMILRMKMWVLLCVGTLLMCPSSSLAQQYFFMPLDTRNGLSENHVKCILQDSWGFMWFGTKNGLNRYDGSTVKRYRVDDEVLKCGNHNVSALYEDAQHHLWVGTDQGVYIFEPSTETFRFFDTKSNLGVQVNNWIAQIVGDKYGNIWIVSPNQGAFRYEVSTKHLTQYTFSKKKGGLSL